MVTLLIRGAEINLHESEKYNKVRKRLNDAKQLVMDYENGDVDGKFEPFHSLSFRTADDGRITVDIDDCIGALSDEPRDGSDED